ncbi:MAG: type II secretion system F family protein [Nanoarchaeota archaeon]|nr:type II secretion system F family protein [Nanoarchaeota archaeon]
MNTLKFYPRKLRKLYLKNIKNSGTEMSVGTYHNYVFWFVLITSLVSLALFYLIKASLLYALLVFIFLHLLLFFRTSLKADARIKKMEAIFPDVISLMASNLRSGTTIDRAFLLAARPEFDPLDKEMLKTGREIVTGQDILHAFKTMAERIDSEKISKVITLILSGLRAGGNISDLLDQTARNMKEKEILEKKSRSTILMYVIFIFFAVGVGAPTLFALSTVLVQIVVSLTASLPETASATATSVPLSFNEITISTSFVMYFSIIFITVTDLISCFVIGLVQKGEGKMGLRYFLPLIAVSYSLFFLLKSFIGNIMADTISFL